MSRDETQRFRITTWPTSVPAPEVVAVPRLVAVADFVFDDWDEDMRVWLDRAPLESRFDVVGPTRQWPAAGGSLSPDADDEEVLVFVDPAFRSEHPGCEDAFVRAAHEVDFPPVVITENAPPRLVGLPDEFALREFMAVDHTDGPAVVAFVDRWGPLVEPIMAEDPSVMRLVPRAWQRFTQSEYDRSLLRPPLSDDRWAPDPVVFGAADVHDLVAEHRHREEARRLQAAAGAALDTIDAVLDRPWQAWGAHRVELAAASGELLSGDEGGDEAHLLSRKPLDVIGLRSYALARQQWLLSLYQTLVESWVRLDPSRDLGRAALARPPRKALAEVWSGRGLPVPSTSFELVGTIQSLLNEALASTGPRVELAHPALAGRGDAYGRPVPRVVAAVCLQLLGWVAAGVPARHCANETCRQWFTRQRGRAEAGQYRTSGVLYCTATCARAQAQREYRRRRRNRD